MKVSLAFEIFPYEGSSVLGVCSDSLKAMKLAEAKAECELTWITSSSQEPKVIRAYGDVYEYAVMEYEVDDVVVTEGGSG